MLSGRNGTRTSNKEVIIEIIIIIRLYHRLVIPQFMEILLILYQPLEIHLYLPPLLLLVLSLSSLVCAIQLNGTKTAFTFLPLTSSPF